MVHDEHWASRVLREVLADRAKEEASESTTTPRTDHDHLCRVVIFQELERRRTFEHVSADLHILIGAKHLLNCRLANRSRV
jgi:hypothetical protein